MKTAQEPSMASPSVRKAVIPAAGMGSRLLPCTKSQPKEMLAVGRLPTIQHVLEELVNADVENICIVTGWQKRAIEDHFDLSHGGLSLLKGDPKELGVLADPELNRRLFYVRQAAQRGLGDAVLHARHFVGADSFLVALGDTILYSPDEPHLIRRLVDGHCGAGVFATIAVEPVRQEDVHRYGIIAPAGELAADGPSAIVDIVEKPSADTAPSRYAVASRYIFEPIIFDAIDRTPPGKNGEIQLHRRDPDADPRRPPLPGRASRAAGQALRHRELRQLLPRLHRHGPARPRRGPGPGRLPQRCAG